MKKFYFTPIHFKSNNENLDNDLSWNIQRVMAGEMIIKRNSSLVKTTTKAARSIVSILKNVQDVTSIEIKGLFHGSAAVLSSENLESCLKTHVEHKCNSLTRDVSVELNILSLPFSQTTTVKPDGVVMEVQYVSKKWKFNREWEYIKSQMDSLHMNSSFLKEKLLEIHGLCFDDPVSFNIFIITVKQRWYSAFIPRDADMNGITAISDLSILKEIEMVSRDWAGYCKSGDHYLTESEIKINIHPYNTQCIRCKKFVKRYRTLGDLRKSFVPRVKMLDYKFEWTINSSLEELFNEMNVSQDSFNNWKADNSYFYQHSLPLEIMFQFFIDNLSQLSSSEDLDLLFSSHGAFQQCIEDKYNLWNGLSMREAFMLTFDAFVGGIDNSHIEIEINDASPMSGNMFCKKHKRDCCNANLPFLKQIDASPESKMEDDFILKDDEELVFHGGAGRSWLAWISECTWALSSGNKSGGDFHDSNESVIYFQRNFTDAKSWGLQKSLPGYYYVVASFAMQKIIVEDKNYIHVVDKEWLDTIKCYRLSDQKEIRSRRKLKIIEGEFCRNGREVCLGRGLAVPKVDHDKDDQLCVKTSEMFENYFRYLGQRLVYHHTQST